MDAGAMVEGRFRIEARVGAGAMGEVFRAKDLTLGRTVALKILRANVPDGRSRFAREIRALERLAHPNVVGHVAHGDGALPFLAMEWLEGEDLRARLGRERLSVSDVVQLGRELADALAHVHARGTVHRDVKPANVILEVGAVDRPKLVDFGLARLIDEGDAAANDFESSSGVLVGTPGYMAPEQARGNAGIAADVFGLGCLLYKCLTGHAPFQAPDMVGTLARVLFDEAAPPSTTVTGIPPELDALVLHMLAKEPTARPSAAEVAQTLRALDGRKGDLRPSSSPKSLTTRERRIVSVVLAYRGSTDDGEETLLGTKSGASPEILDRVRALTERYGAHVEFLGLSILAVFADRGGATEQAGRAARLGLELAEVLPDTPIAVATGRAEVAQRVVGDAVEAAVAIARSGTPGKLSSDAITVGLLGAAFDVAEKPGGLVIERALPRGEVAPRTLLGKPTPCVGRDRELSDLTALLDDCIAQPRAEVAIVVAPSGTGKSRLRFEWLARVAARENAPRVVMARCDAMTGSAPLALAAQWIRETAAISPSEGSSLARARIAARVAAIAPPSEVARLTDFLSEIAGANPDGGVSIQLTAARIDPMLMSDQLRSAFTDWLRWETAAGPFVCVVDDLHWGDAASVRLVDAALDVLRDEPLFVFALARPELDTTFPSLWEGRTLTKRRLPELASSAATTLARAVLGDEASATEIDALVKRAAGNAFFLEEMLRAHAEGQGADAPETVQAVVQRRLETFAEPTRRALRAAAIFGMSFWTTAVDALLGGDTKSGQVLRELRDREVLSTRSGSRFDGEEEWVFRHAYVREAAYAMSTDEDRALGHRLAGEWLETHQERDALLLADHFARGGRPARTIPHLRRAAKQALDANDLELVVQIAERGREAGATGEALGEMCRYAAEALRWRARLEESMKYATVAVAELRPSTPNWYAALGELATAATVQGHVDELLRVKQALIDDASPLAFSSARVVALARVSGQLVVAGKPRDADRLIVLAETADTQGSATAQARVAQARGFRALHASDPAVYRRETFEARRLFETIGDRRNVCVQSVNLGSAIQALGRPDRALEVYLPARAAGVTLGLKRLVALLDQNIALVYFEQGDLERSTSIQRTAVEFFSSQGDRRLEAFSRIYLSWSLRASGSIDEAFDEARRAVKVSDVLPPAHAAAQATLAELELHHGDVAVAGPLIEAAYATLESLGGLEECETLVRLVHADVALHRGDHAAARKDLARALERLAERLSGIDEPDLRRSFLGAVAINRRLLDSARAEGVPIPDAIARTLADGVP